MNIDAEKQREFEDTWSNPKGIKGIFMVVNNQPLGKRFMGTALIFFALGGLLALLMRMQLARANNDFLSPDTYNQLFTVHGSTMMFLFAVPFIESLALYLLPLMLGTRDAAFPRLGAFSYWLYLFGGIFFYISFLTGEAPDAGWFAYTPLSGPKYSGLGLDFWVLGLGMVEISGLATGIELAVTILKTRARGLSLSQLPLFAWSILVTSIMIIFAFTVLLMATFMLELDRLAGTRFFDPDFGGSSLLWQHLFWFFGHPEVYIMFLPATGIISAIVATFAKRPVKAHAWVALAIVITAFVSFGLWVHHMFTTGLPELSKAFFTGASLIIAVASGIQVFAWIATVWGRNPALKVPFLYFIGFMANFVAGGVTGFMVAVVPFDLQVHDTFFVVAHFHYVLIGGVVFPIFAALAYWLPKITGKMMSEKIGKISFWLTFIGFNITFFPMHLMGFQGMPRRIYTYPEELNLGEMNFLSTIGAFILAAGSIVFFYNFIITLRKGQVAGDNPWGAHSMEWTLPSPPPIYAYLRPPRYSEEEGMYRPYEGEPDKIEQALTAGPANWRAIPVGHALSGEIEAIQWLPGPTLLPFLAASTLLVAFLGLLLKLYLLSVVASVFFFGMIVQWAWPSMPRKIQEEALEMEKHYGINARPTGSKSLVWWGSIGLIIVMAVAIGALFFSYFYLWLYSNIWPQDNLPLPDPKWFCLALALLILSYPPIYWIKHCIQTGNCRWISIAGLTGFTLGMTALAIIIWSLFNLEFGPTVNAYASAFHSICWLLIIYLLSGLGLILSVLSSIITEKFIEVPAFLLHAQVTNMLWLFMVLISVAVGMVLYLAPRIIN